ncbi:MAG: methyltransferase domain-containing protein, partial [Syntrophobacter sp.]
MGEFFERVKPVRPLEWTGERLTTDTTGQVEVEHVHRYLFARHLVRGLDVLDIASGEGYGSAFLAQTAHSVTGVEIDPEVVEHARGAYVAQNLRFIEGSAQSIPLDDESVDCVVSFETIEHFYDHEKFFGEIRRVLKPGGKLIISSPNRDVYSPPRGPFNPYHVRELSLKDFENLIRASFDHVMLLGQRPIVGSVIIRQSGVDRPFDCLTFEHLDGDRFEASAGLDRTLYYIAIASDVPFPPCPETFYFERGTIDEVMVTLPALRLEHQHLQEHIIQEGAIKEAQMQTIKTLESTLEEEHARAECLETTIESLKAELLRLGILESALKEEKVRADGFAEKIELLRTMLLGFEAALKEESSRADSFAAKTELLQTMIFGFEAALKDERARAEGLAEKVELLRAGILRITNTLSIKLEYFLRRKINWNKYDAAYHAWSKYKRRHISKHAALKEIENKYGVPSFFLFYPLYKALKPLVKISQKILGRKRAKEKGLAELIGKTSLFTASFYVRQNPDVAGAGINPLEHYLSHGAAEGRDPSPLFDTSFYLESNPGVAGAGINPLEHYLSHGAAEGRDPNPLFDTSFYLGSNPDLAGAGINPLEHYMSHGAAEGRDPNPLFDTSFYLGSNPDVASAGINPLEHYMSHGAAEGRDPNPLFDTSFYLGSNPDVASAGINPLEHYLSHGAAEGRDPNPLFDTSFYLERNPDVAGAGINPLEHYMSHGAAEGRDP